MAGRSPFELKYMPEQGIELHGKVVSMVRSKPRANVEVTAFLASPGDDPESKNQKFFDLFTTDSLGRFSFVSQIEGKWNLILAATEKGKKKDYRIVLDRVFAPSPACIRWLKCRLELPERKKDPAYLSVNLLTRWKPKKTTNYCSRHTKIH